MILRLVNALAYDAGHIIGRIIERRYRKSVAQLVPDDLAAIAEATGVLVPVAEVRQAMRERLFDDLCADWAREIEACLPEYVAEWEAS